MLYKLIKFPLTLRSYEIWLRLILTSPEARIWAGPTVDGKAYGPEIKLALEA
jgi:hypothetical protein